jgi:hypothetical protein
MEIINNIIQTFKDEPLICSLGTLALVFIVWLIVAIRKAQVMPDWFEDNRDIVPKKDLDNTDSHREAAFIAWKEKHDREVKKCLCETPNPRPTNKNECWDCNGEIYKDYLDKVRWFGIEVYKAPIIDDER